jgi:hypothetical protein
MKSKGFIVVASEYPLKKTIDDAEQTDIHVEDLNCGLVAPDDQSTDIVRIYIESIGHFLTFTRAEAREFTAAVKTIVDRYEITPAQWEARNA